MANKLFLFVVLGATLALALADINTSRKQAIQKINGYVDDMKRLADETSIEVGKREENIKIISKHVKEFGDGILDNVNFQVKRTAATAYMMAKLLGSSNEVFRCIETREREGLDDAARFYNQKFLEPGRDYESKADDLQKRTIKAWKDDYYSASGQYQDIYNKAIREVGRATSESAIANIVRQFEETTRQMAKIITNIHPNMAKIHIDALGAFDKLIAYVQQYAKYRVEETTKAIQNCFPKF